MMLADGVFAIAITFLAVDIGPPAGWAGGLGDLWGPLAWQLDTYAVSFIVISVFWLAHRRFMAMVLAVDAPLTVLTLVMLGLVALLPPATRMLQAHLAFPAARITYAGLVIAIGISMAVIWGYAGLAAKVVHSEVGGRAHWFLLALIVATPPLILTLNFVIPGTPPPGVVPVVLLALFVIGWRLRLWTLKRLGALRHVG
jgi:uncharacterized membrane protein